MRLQFFIPATNRSTSDVRNGRPLGYELPRISYASNGPSTTAQQIPLRIPLQKRVRLRCVHLLSSSLLLPLLLIECYRFGFRVLMRTTSRICSTRSTLGILEARRIPSNITFRLQRGPTSKTHSSGGLHSCPVAVKLVSPLHGWRLIFLVLLVSVNRYYNTTSSHITLLLHSHFCRRRTRVLTRGVNCFQAAPRTIGRVDTGIHRARIMVVS